MVALLLTARLLRASARTTAALQASGNDAVQLRCIMKIVKHVSLLLCGSKQAHPEDQSQRARTTSAREWRETSNATTLIVKSRAKIGPTCQLARARVRLARHAVWPRSSRKFNERRGSERKLSSGSHGERCGNGSGEGRPSPRSAELRGGEILNWGGRAKALRALKPACKGMEPYSRTRKALISPVRPSFSLIHRRFCFGLPILGLLSLSDRGCMAESELRRVSEMLPREHGLIVPRSFNDVLLPRGKTVFVKGKTVRNHRYANCSDGFDASTLTSCHRERCTVVWPQCRYDVQHR